MKLLSILYSGLHCIPSACREAAGRRSCPRAVPEEHHVIVECGPRWGLVERREKDGGRRPFAELVRSEETVIGRCRGAH
jgi:hypothetical protein